MFICAFSDFPKHTRLCIFGKNRLAWVGMQSRNKYDQKGHFHPRFMALVAVVCSEGPAAALRLTLTVQKIAGGVFFFKNSIYAPAKSLGFFPKI